MGKKGLIYSSTTLEYHLSHTDSLWPGDADLILFDDSDIPKAVIEFKKHTLDHPIENHTFNNYYPKPDGRKYDRLAIFKEYFESKLEIKIPLIVLHYPTSRDIKTVILEEITGDHGQLKVSQTITLPLPNKVSDITQIITSIENFNENIP